MLAWILVVVRQWILQTAIKLGRGLISEEKPTLAGSSLAVQT